MNDFLDLLRRSLRHRWSLAMAAGLSLFVGVLWAANISTLYPLIDTAFQGESVGKALRLKIEQSEDRIRAIDRELRQLAEEIVADTDAGVEKWDARRQLLETRRDAETRALSTFRAWIPWAERHLPEDPFTTIAFILGAVLVATAAKGLCLALGDILVNRVTYRLMFDLRRRLFRHVLSMDMAFFATQRVHRLMSRLTHDMNRVTEGVQIALGVGLREPLKVIACLLGAALISWRLLLVTLCVSPLGIGAIRWMSTSLRRNTTRNLAAMSELYERIGESLGAIFLVKALGGERVERHRFFQASKGIYTRMLRWSRIRAFIRPTVELVGMVMVGIGMLVGAYLVVHRETHLWGVPLTSQPLSPAGLLVFYAFLVGLMDPVRKLSAALVKIQISATAAQRLGELLRTTSTVEDPVDPVACPRPHTIAFHGVCFAYRPAKDVLSNIDFRLEAGECLAVLGHNGSGKSTLAHLLLRLHDPSAGRITWNGIDLRTFRQRDLREHIGVVSQQTILLDDTVANNIRYGRPEADDQAVQAAALLAGAHSFILENLPHGYSTQVGEKGSSLSGGEAQRIALARAVLRDPAILILDEATSQLDSSAEEESIEQLRAFVRQRTTLMITHRPRLLRLATRVLILRRGSVVASGTPEELWRRSSHYRQLIQEPRRDAA